jgi:tRNA uridine 5-carbamoylmethylation protein Kti12
MGFGGMGTSSTEGEKKSSGAAAETAFSKVQRFIKDSQKSLANAQKTYNSAIKAAKDNYVESVLRTEQQFAEKLAGIVQQSQNRLRNAFASAVRVSLTDIFTVEETSSVENLVQGLQERLSKSRNLLNKAAELNAAGFSQTFIEQVVEAGVETGNELAGAILAATPETQAQLQQLFSEVEDTADTGMDSLAQEIYDKAGLATRELRELYSETQQELVDTLLDLKKNLDASIVDANQSFVDSIKDIREQLQENIAGMKGDLGGLEGTLEQFYNKLNKLQGGAEDDITSVSKTTESATETATAAADTVAVAASAVQGATGILIDSASDVAGVYSYLGERIAAAERFARNIGDPRQAESALAIAEEFRQQQQGLRAGVSTGTVININVKTDSTQSVAMVGKTLGNTINKYVTAGGQVLVSPT